MFRLFVVGILAQLCEHAVGGLGMEECDIEALCAFAGSLVNESYALGLHLVEGVLHTILNAECEVVDAFAPFLDEAGDSSVRRGALEQLELGLSDFEESGSYFLVGNLFDRVAFEAQHVLVIRNSLVQRLDGDSEVFDM